MQRGRLAMGGMMGTTGTGAWILVWVFLGLAFAVLAGVVVARALDTGRQAHPTFPSAESPGVREAKDALRLRYAKGEISREEYLQGKVELDD